MVANIHVTSLITSVFVCMFYVAKEIGGELHEICILSAQLFTVLGILSESKLLVLVNYNYTLTLERGFVYISIRAYLSSLSLLYCI